jgi:hypothetical protein
MVQDHDSEMAGIKTRGIETYHLPGGKDCHCSHGWASLGKPWRCESDVVIDTSGKVSNFSPAEWPGSVVRLHFVSIVLVRKCP